MTRAALTKLFILVILAFIICLPEFFSLYRVSKVNFLCQPYRPCERENQVNKGENGNNSDAEINRTDMCDPSQTPEHEKWEWACAQHKQRNRTDPGRGGEDPEDSWFMCQTDMDMAVLHSNISSSVLQVYLEVSVEFQFHDTQILNLTLYGRSNYSSLYLHLPEEEEEQKGDEGQKEIFYCCLPVLPTSESANQSRCLLWFANQTVLTAKEKPSWKWKWTQKEWWCRFKVLWLALVCMILAIVVTVVLRQIYWQNCSCKNPKVHPVHYDFTGQQLTGKLKYGEKQAEITPKGTIPHSYESQTCSGLSPIPESEIQEDMEMLLDGNVDNCYTAKLHHRVHLSTSSLTEEQVW